MKCIEHMMFLPADLHHPLFFGYDLEQEKIHIGDGNFLTQDKLRKIHELDS